MLHGSPNSLTQTSASLSINWPDTSEGEETVGGSPVDSYCSTAAAAATNSVLGTSTSSGFDNNNRSAAPSYVAAENLAAKNYCFNGSPLFTACCSPPAPSPASASWSSCFASSSSSSPATRNHQSSAYTRKRPIDNRLPSPLHGIIREQEEGFLTLNADWSVFRAPPLLNTPPWCSAAAAPTQQSSPLQALSSFAGVAPPPMKKLFGFGSSSRQQKTHSSSNGGGAGSGVPGSAGGAAVAFSTSSESAAGSARNLHNTSPTKQQRMDADQAAQLLHEKDLIIKKQENEIRTHLHKIAELESNVKSLQSECDKLRSVLYVKSSPTPDGSNQDVKAAAAALDDSSGPAQPKNKSKSSDELRAELQTQANMVGQAANFNKKQGVSAEPDIYHTDKIKLIHHKKSAESKHLIRDAVLQNDFLRHLDKDQVTEIVECMYEKQVPSEEYVIKEGESGAHLYVAGGGELEVSKGGAVLGKLGPGKVFGELAILYNCTRTASVRALTNVRLWVLDRAVFQMITMRLGLQRHETLMQFLHDVPLFKNLSEDRFSKLSDSLDLDYYSGGTYIIREGEKGDTFFIISSGEVKVTQLVEGYDEPQEIRTLKKGDFFGEKALLGEEVRTASIVATPPGVEVLTLDRESFRKLIGDLRELQRDYGDEQRGAKRLGRMSTTTGPTTPITPTAPSSQTSLEGPTVLTKVSCDKEFEHVELHHLKPIATLGVGGFGRVDLVTLVNDNKRAFALKAMKKKHIVDTRQQEHIFSERNLMYEMKSSYVVRLFKTFRDRKYVYMLLEVCLGGELWTILRDKGHFDDSTARFYVSCVIEGLEYLHKRNIIYRDLKPENCLIDGTGYLKLVDFGFAKRLGGGRKTWTFCGTPEYVAPEIILNKGHDHSADYWAMGIYICELLLGRPPFQASDPMKTYTLILKGVDALDIPNRRIGKTATALVKKLCRDNPAERMGCQAGGLDDARKHRWFLGFDWDGLRSHSLKPPIFPKISGPLDVSNFDHYPPDHDVPPDEFSGWDEGF